MKLPVLGDVRVASPCGAAWSAMGGDERSRMCGACAQRVYNLSAMTGAEARALIAANQGDLCVRFYARADGTLLLGEDCAVGVAVARRSRPARARRAGSAALLAASLLATGAVSEHRPPHMNTYYGMELDDADYAQALANPQMGKYDGAYADAIAGSKKFR